MYIRKNQHGTIFDLFLSLTRARPGGGYPPLRFFVDSEKRRRAAQPNFAQLFIEHFDTFTENFALLTSKVTPPGVRIKAVPCGRDEVCKNAT